MLDEQTPPSLLARLPSFLPAAAEYVVVVACMLIFGLFAMGIGKLLITGNNPSGRDIVSFWAAGQRVAHHANPYDSDAVVAMERSAGFPTTAQPLIMRNPPSALALVVPLGWLSLRTASLLWSILLLGAFALSVHLLRQFVDRPGSRIYLLGYSFGPAIGCVLGGQTSLFALLGLVLFFRLHRNHAFYAGLALWLCALKPHLFLPFGVALLFWIVDTRHYRIAVAAALALAASSLAAMHLDPAIWTNYAEMMHAPEIRNEFIPCLGIALRRAIHPQSLWLQYVPAALGCVWAAWFYLRHRTTWDWINHGALLMLVSMLVSPYSWVTDQAVLMPAVLLGAYRATSRAQLAAVAVVSMAIEVAQISGKGMHSAIYGWLPLYWLLWFLYVSLKRRTQTDTNAAPPDLFVDRRRAVPTAC
jgi:hypothetical protein